MKSSGLFLALFLTIPGIAAGACTSTTTPTVLLGDLTRASSAYTELDGVGFAAGMTRANDDLRCVDALVKPNIAAYFHRMTALSEYVIPNEEHANNAILAARSTDPSFAIADGLLAPDHPLRQAYEADSGVARTSRVPSPRSGEVAFDGVVSLARPTDRASIFQLIDDEHGTAQTVYLFAQDPLPTYPRKRSPLASGFLATGALAALATSAGAYLSASAAHRDFWADDTTITLDGLHTLQDRSRTMSGVATVSVIVGVGLGGAAVAMVP